MAVKEFAKTDHTLFTVNICARLTDIDIRRIRETASMLRRLLKKEEASFAKYANDFSKNLSPWDKAEYEDMMSDRHYQLTDIMPTITAASFFVMAYSMVEYNLIKLCRAVQRPIKTSFSLRDFEGDDVEKTKIFIQKVIGLSNFFSKSRTWSEIVTFNFIRNYVVHHGGVLNDDKRAKQIRSYCKRQTSIIIEYNELKISFSFVDHVLKIIEAFFEELFTALRQWHTRSKASI